MIQEWKKQGGKGPGESPQIHNPLVTPPRLLHSPSIGRQMLGSHFPKDMG